jgi:hypothetical protein
VISTKEALLLDEERLLAWLLWLQKAILPGNRWYPVMQRYIGYIEGRVKGFGGNPAHILPSPTGAVPGWPVRGSGSRHPGGAGKGGSLGHELGKDHHLTGKIIGIIYDRFGDFEGFVLLTEEGEERVFRGREHEVEELVREAWVERFLVSVFVRSHDGEWPDAIVLRR